MNKKAQVSIICLWVLAILSILAVGVGRRVSIALRLSAYQKDKLKAFYLAKAGVNRAIEEIRRDTNEFDTLNEKWADNKDILEKISLNEVEGEFASARVTDEEAKININTASFELLASFLDISEVTESEKIANNILAWRGEGGVIIPEYQDLGYTNKASKFSNIEELMLIKDVHPDIYNLIKESFTTFGSGKININTASDIVFKALIESCVKKLEKEGNSERQPLDLLEKILQLRQEGAVFTSLSDLNNKLKDLTSGQTNILNKFSEEAEVKSTCFFITSDGKIIRYKVSANISCVYDKIAYKTIYWHEI